MQEEFEAYLKCGRLEHGFLRVRCEDCHAEKRVAFSCKRRGFCPSCGARRMTDSAALLSDEVLQGRSKYLSAESLYFTRDEVENVANRYARMRCSWRKPGS